MQKDETTKILGAGGDGSIDSGTPAVSVGSLIVGLKEVASWLHLEPTIWAPSSYEIIILLHNGSPFYS